MSLRTHLHAYPHTQKARGFYDLATERCHSLREPATRLTVPKVTADLSAIVPVAGDYRALQFPLFARPCPLRPRHGFVELRPVKNMTEVFSVYRETLAADPDGEVILTPRLDGEFSAVGTNAGIAFGKGHDGVTGGKSSLFIPAVSDTSHWKNLREAGNGIGDIKESLFVECVSYRSSKNQNGLAPVQLRDGPALPATLDYIPRAETISRVLTCSEDYSLLAWESDVANAFRANGDKPDGIVFDHIGGALSSHYAVHAVQHGIAVITQGEHPKIGDSLQQNAETVKLDLSARQFIAESLAHYFVSDKPVTGASLATAVASVHAGAAWGDAEHLLKLRAFSAVELYRAIGTACLGEARHANSRAGHGEDSNVDWRAFGFESHGIYGKHRDSIFGAAYGVDPATFLKAVRASRIDFDCEWQSSSYGGRKWRDCADGALELFRRATRYIEKPTIKRLASLGSACNSALHLAHNGGNVLTKFVSDRVLSNINNTPTLGFMNPHAGELLLNNEPIQRTWHAMFQPSPKGI